MRDAVSAIFIFETQFFVIKRQNHLLAFPGYYAFPGGKVEEDDLRKKYENTHGLGDGDLNCLEREIMEELGLNILSDKRVKKIALLGRAISPEFTPRRFDTRFVKIYLNEKIKFDLDENEMSLGRWMTPANFIEEYHRGKIMVVPPIYRGIKQLADDMSFEGGEQNFLGYFKLHETPMMEAICGVKQFMPYSDTLPPADRTNCFLIGEKEDKRFIVDPSPKNQDEYDALVHSLERYSFKKIIITHHHRDHYQFANQLAKQLKLPLCMSGYTRNRIQEKHPDFFIGVDLRFLEEGHIVGTWLGEDVRTYEIPGHDKGQLGFAPESLEWFLVGDLIQGVGTVVVGEPEGDMSEYFNTLKRVISLNPNAILPSHGIPMGGVHRLLETLKHREMREAQIQTYLGQGKNPEEILNLIYQDVPKELHRYALKNILAHIKKIENDNK